MSVFYNEIDPFAASWLLSLIAEKLIPDGIVDERSIADLEPSDLAGFRQCHFFAGIGGWPRALILAGFAPDREIWTASLPCQPLSVAGKREGDADERHLWPAFYRLVAELHPARIVGEQVASADGREWLAGIRADLADAGYACGAANLPACAVGAPHRRERLYWCAVADAKGERWRRRQDNQDGGRGKFSSADSGAGSLGAADQSGSQGRSVHAERQSEQAAWAGGLGFWDDAEWRVGADGKSRRVKPGVRLLAHGIPNRVGRLRGYGNAIVPQVAAKFIQAAIS